MSGRNAYLARIGQAKNEAALSAHRFTRQLMVDLVYITLNREFGFGADRLERLAVALRKTYDEYADLWNGDTMDTEYSRGVLDSKLRQIFGEKFDSWDVRYGGQR